MKGKVMKREYVEWFYEALALMTEGEEWCRDLKRETKSDGPVYMTSAFNDLA